ncbi:hypothetical protein [Candidatus Tisiphia endosymbiont of Micropterix aruncella]|uniref:hypothetical protein n=1 Tax=Candidatus Tisiphia endosymbiont of Micropterix aruncella TaxID=3066271 RepID=UPI003AA94E2F
MPNTEIQKAQKVLESVQKVDVLQICTIFNVSQKTQDKFLKGVTYKSSIQLTKEFFNKEKVKLEDECKKLVKQNKSSGEEYIAKVTEIKAIYKVLDIAILLEKLNLNIIDILKTAGISPDICDKLKDYTIKQALQCLEKWNNELTTENNDSNTASSTKPKVLTESVHDQLVSRYSASIKELQAKNNDPNTPSPTKPKVLTESAYSAPIKELQAKNNDPNTPSPTKSKVLTDSTHDQIIQEFKSKMKKNDSQESGYSGSSSDELTNSSASSSKPLLANTSTISNKLPPCPPPRDYSKHKQNVDIPNKYHDSDSDHHPILVGEHPDVSF